MTRRPIIATIATALALLVLPASAAHEYEASDTTDEKMQFSAGTLDIAAVDGDVELRGWDKDWVRVEAWRRVRVYKDRARLRDEADQALRDIDLILDQRGDRLTIRTEFPRACRNDLDCRLNLRISIPDHLTLVARSEDGDVTIVGTRGDLDLELRDGDARLEDVRGNIRVEAEDGDVTASLGRDSTASIEVEDGDINLALAVDPGESPAIYAVPDDGKIRSEFPVFTSLESYDAAIRGGSRGAGWPRLDLRTRDGDIWITR